MRCMLMLCTLCHAMMQRLHLRRQPRVALEARVVRKRHLAERVPVTTCRTWCSVATLGASQPRNVLVAGAELQEVDAHVVEARREHLDVQHELRQEGRPRHLAKGGWGGGVGV